MNEENINVALVVHSCDRYELLYKGLSCSFQKNWDFNIPCKFYLSTEEKKVNIPGFENIQAGKDTWADRFRFILTEKIKEEYILFFQEDMWLTKKVNANFFIELFKIVAEKNWKMVKLHSSDVYKTITTPYFIEGFNIATVDIDNSKFLFSHQVTLYHRNFLLSQLYKNEQPWENEMKASERLKHVKSEIMHVDYFAQNGNAEINQNKNPVGRSEYQGVSYNSTLHHNVRPFIAEWMKGNREQKNYAKQLRHHYLFELTHDGKSRPQKESLLLNFKIWLKGLKPRLAFLLFGKVK